MPRLLILLPWGESDVGSFRQFVRFARMCRIPLTGKIWSISKRERINKDERERERECKLSLPLLVAKVVAKVVVVVVEKERFPFSNSNAFRRRESHFGANVWRPSERLEGVN